MALYRCGGGSKITSYTTIADNVTSASSENTYTIDKAGMYIVSQVISNTGPSIPGLPTVTGTVVLTYGHRSNIRDDVYGAYRNTFVWCNVGDTITIGKGLYLRHSIYLLS